MDVTHLINNYEAISEQGQDRKGMALRYVHKILKKSTEYDAFVKTVSNSTKDFFFGSESDDFYYTSFLAVVGDFEPSIDSLLFATLNKLTLQLEFQTRHLGEGRGPELLVYEGPDLPYYAAMANANVAAGVLVTLGPDGGVPMRPWCTGLPNIEFNTDNLHARRRENIPGFLRDLGRKIGCIAIVLPIAPGPAGFAERYADCAPYVSQFTSYLISGPRELVEGVAAEAVSRHPDAKVTHKSYHILNGSLREEKCLVLIEDLGELPDIQLRARVEIPCTFVMAHESPNPDFATIDYIESEYVRPKTPVSIKTYVPLSEENSKKLNSEFEFFHNLVSIKNGSMVGVSGAVDSSYLYFAESGEVAMDAGNEHARTMIMDVYKNGTTIDGIRHSTITAGNVQRITGAAMPLTFTPDVHFFFSHFILQCMPRLLILDQIGRRDVKIIVPHNLRRKQHDMLRLAGISDDRIVPISPGVALKADELLVPRAWPLAMSPFTIQIYQQMLEKVVGKQSSAPTRRLLISRESRRTWRNMVTYDAVRQTLVDDHGFSELRPETLTIEEEIQLFNEVKILVGAEGAGLYGSCFSQSAANVISLCDEDYMMPILGTIAKMRDFNLYHVFGESFRSDLDLPRRLPYGHCDFSIDPFAVTDMLRHCV